MLREQVNNVRVVVVSPLWRGPGNIHGSILFEWIILPTRIGYCSNVNCARRFWCEANNVAFTHMQPHFYSVRQVEPCHHLG